jgi:hypothetical protein
MRQMRNAYTNLVGISEGKRPLSIPRHRWRIILKIVLNNLLRWNGSSDRRQGRVKNYCKVFNKMLFIDIRASVDFSRRALIQQAVSLYYVASKRYKFQVFVWSSQRCAVTFLAAVIRATVSLILLASEAPPCRTARRGTLNRRDPKLDGYYRIDPAGTNTRDNFHPLTNFT